MGKQIFVECEKCEGYGIDLSHVSGGIENLVHREGIPACEVCKGWGEIEKQMEG